MKSLRLRRLSALISIVLCLTLVLACVNTYAADGVIAEGSFEGAKWRISSSGHLDISGHATSLPETEDDMPPWYPYREKVTSASISITGLDEAYNLFSGMTNLKSVDVSKWDISSVTEMIGLFSDCSSLTTLDIGSWDTSRIVEMSEMFSGCSSLKRLNIGNWNTSAVTSMSQMFSGCSSLTRLDIGRWNTSSVTEMYDMFNDCESLTTLDLNNWNTSAVTDMTGMFMNCSGLTSLKVSKWNTRNVTDMAQMFRECSSLTELDLRGWDTSSATDMEEFMAECMGLKKFIAPKKFGSAYSKEIEFPRFNWIDSNGNEVTNVTKNLNVPMTYVVSEEKDIVRIFGGSRYETSMLIADELAKALNENSESPEKFNAVVLAYGMNYPDALAGSYLAIASGAPILLIDDQHIDSVYRYVCNMLSEEGTVYILGGTGAVSKKVESRFNSSFNTIRIGGSSRYDTNLKILAEGLGDGTLSDIPVYVCSGEGYADSLSASSSGYPILIVDPRTGLSKKQLNFLTEKNANTFVIAGGESAVSADVEDKLGSLGEVERIGGMTRYETSAEIAAWGTIDELDLYAVLAYGENFPDGLCAGPLAWARGASVILCKDGAIENAQKYMDEFDVMYGYVLGGPSLISDEAVREIFRMK